jgi:drug/metabolite transporter (DMT)-like permease
MLYLALLVTAAAFVLWYSAVAALGAAAAGLLTGVAPISAALSGLAIDGHAPGLLVWTGIAVVLAGLAVGLSGQRSVRRLDAISARNEVTAVAIAGVPRLSE